jgi:hypothetical protein
VPIVFRNGTGLASTIPGPVAQQWKCAGVRGALLALTPAVIWFYERHGEHLRCEIRQQVEGDRFALVMTLPDGTERTEMFEDSYALNRRSLEIEIMLSQKGWNGPFARDI